MVDVEVIKQRLVQLSTYLNKIERFKDLSLEEFLNDYNDKINYKRHPFIHWMSFLF